MTQFLLSWVMPTAAMLQSVCSVLDVFCVCWRVSRGHVYLGFSSGVGLRWPLRGLRVQLRSPPRGGAHGQAGLSHEREAKTAKRRAGLLPAYSLCCAQDVGQHLHPGTAAACAFGNGCTTFHGRVAGKDCCLQSLMKTAVDVSFSVHGVTAIA